MLCLIVLSFVSVVCADPLGSFEYKFEIKHPGGASSYGSEYGTPAKTTVHFSGGAGTGYPTPSASQYGYSKEQEVAYAPQGYQQYQAHGDEGKAASQYAYKPVQYAAPKDSQYAAQPVKFDDEKYQYVNPPSGGHEAAPSGHEQTHAHQQVKYVTQEEAAQYQQHFTHAHPQHQQHQQEQQIQYVPASEAHKYQQVPASELHKYQQQGHPSEGHKYQQVHNAEGHKYEHLPSSEAQKYQQVPEAEAPKYQHVHPNEAHKYEHVSDAHKYQQIQQGHQGHSGHGSHEYPQGAAATSAGNYKQAEYAHPSVGHQRPIAAHAVHNDKEEQYAHANHAHPQPEHYAHDGGSGHGGGKHEPQQQVQYVPHAHYEQPSHNHGHYQQDGKSHYTESRHSGYTPAYASKQHYEGANGQQSQHKHAQPVKYEYVTQSKRHEGLHYAPKEDAYQTHGAQGKHDQAALARYQYTHKDNSDKYGYTSDSAKYQFVPQGHKVAFQTEKSEEGKYQQVEQPQGHAPAGGYGQKVKFDLSPQAHQFAYGGHGGQQAVGGYPAGYQPVYNSESPASRYAVEGHQQTKPEGHGGEYQAQQLQTGHYASAAHAPVKYQKATGQNSFPDHLAHGIARGSPKTHDYYDKKSKKKSS